MYLNKYYQSNKEKITKTSRADYAENKQKRLSRSKEYQKENAERIRLMRAAYYQKFKSKIEEKKNIRRKKRMATDPAYAMKCRLRGRLAAALRHFKAQKQNTTIGLLGCRIEELMGHLQSKFLPGMNWNNRKLWHIDHIRPCASFDLLDPEQQKQCFHYTNLQPLWAADNIRKSDKYEQLEAK